MWLLPRWRCGSVSGGCLLIEFSLALTYRQRRLRPPRPERSTGVQRLRMAEYIVGGTSPCCIVAEGCKQNLGVGGTVSGRVVG
jgi:hypothetical protein